VRLRELGIASVALLASCKERRDTAPSVATSSPGLAAPADAAVQQTAPSRPSLPTPAQAPLGDPLSIDDAAKVLPALDGKQILALKQTSDRRQVHGTWCLDGDGADDVARKVGRAMADARFQDISLRGDARKAGVQGDRDGFRMSMIVSASSAASCPAPKHYFASATIFRS
jgi:hypothetical protein